MATPIVARPTTLDEAWRQFETNPEIVPIAGATAAQLDWRATGVPKQLLDLTAIQGEIRSIGSSADAGLWIGATVRLAALLRDPSVRGGYPQLAAIVAGIGSPGVRTMATVGGNICRVAGCAVPILASLDARLTVHDSAGRRQVPALDWLAARADGSSSAILLGLTLPSPPDLVVAEKIGLRQGFSPSVAGVAAALRFGSGERVAAARLCVGAGARPALLTNAADLMIGRRLAEIDWRTLGATLAAEIEAEDDPFRSARYKRMAAANAMVCALGGDTALGPPPRRAASRPRVARTPRFSQRSIARRDAEPWPIRPDLPDKVTGRLRYLTDRRTDGMLVGRILRAGLPHARILRLDTSAAERLPGVRAVVTGADVPGLNAYGIIVQDQPALCADRVRYVGDPVAAVAAVDAETAARALALIEVTYEPLPVVGDVTKALLPDAPPIHAGGNLHDADSFERGDVDSAWASCAHVVEDTYVTPRQMHVFMETEGGFARPTPDGGVEIFVGAQSNTRDRLQLARILALPESKVRVVSSPTGGAFGGKDELTVQPPLALLAMKAGAAVRLQLDRAESVIAGWKRTPLIIRMRTGCDARGRLLAQDVDLICETGAYGSWSAAVMHAALGQGANAYAIPNVRLSGRTVYTNNGVAGAFRGFGVNQMVFAVEAQLDRLAELVGLDPVAMRRLNLRKPGDPGIFGQTLSSSERLEEVLDHAAASNLWSKPRGPAPDGRSVTGIGLGLVVQPLGLGSLIPDDGGGRLALRPDGKIEAAFSFDEFGQGVMGLIQASVAAALGCGREDIAPVVGDTDAAPDSGATIASRSTTIVGQVARLAGPALARAILDHAALLLNQPAAELRIVAGGIADSTGTFLLDFAALAAWIGVERLPSQTVSSTFPKNDSADRNTLFLHAYAAALARVSVDRVTGMVRLLDLDHHSAAGAVMDPPGYLGQFEGGGLQGAGMALIEDTIIRQGEFVTRNLDSYMAPTAKDAPERMRVYAVEALDPDDPYGPRGIGELSIGAAAAAVAAAVADATGARTTTLPLAPETLLDALSPDETP